MAQILDFEPVFVWIYLKKLPKCLTLNQRHRYLAETNLSNSVPLLVHDGDVDAGLDGAKLARFQGIWKGSEIVLLEIKLTQEGLSGILHW
jgi:hypothetical protein